MNRSARSLALVLVAGASMSVTPAPRPYSAALLAMLDPTLAVRDLCGGKGAGSMRARLMIAAAVVQASPAAAATAAAPLYDGLG
jgi:hypothetical protein